MHRGTHSREGKQPINDLRLVPPASEPSLSFITEHIVSLKEMDWLTEFVVKIGIQNV